MLLNNVCGYVVLLLTAILITIIVVNLIRKHLYSLVEEVVKLPSAAIFYARAFTLALFFLVLANVIGYKFDFKLDTPFMEYVWKVAAGFEEVFRNISLFLLGYVFLITILVVVLKRRND